MWCIAVVASSGAPCFEGVLCYFFVVSRKGVRKAAKPDVRDGRVPGVFLVDGRHVLRRGCDVIWESAVCAVNKMLQA